MMRALISILAIVASSLFAIGGESLTKPVLSFSLTATNHSFAHQVGSGLILRVERDELGWEAGVFRAHSTENLLYPQHVWHGAFPCQLSAWSYRRWTFPDERVIAIRGSKSSVRIRLIDAAVSGASGSEQFTGGRVEIHWKP
jgi:hypothetical protein